MHLRWHVFNGSQAIKFLWTLSQEQGFNGFSATPPRSSLKKLNILTPRLIQGLHTMSLATKGIKDKECERFALQEHPPVPYMPEKDPVKETICALKSDQLPLGKTWSFTSPSSTLECERLFSCT